MSDRLEVLFEEPAPGALDTDAIRQVLPPVPGTRALPQTSALAEFHGGPLQIPLREDRPTVIANFVSTIDGVVSFAEPGASGGSAVSGAFAPDRRMMGLLRALSDAVMIGAGTARHARNEEWTPRDVDPELAADQARVRRELGLAAQPTTVVVSGSGDVDVAQRGLSAADVPVLIASTIAGAAHIGGEPGDERLRVAALGDVEVGIPALLSELDLAGVGLVLCEGGPHLIASLLAAGALDELFLTVAPQVAGRDSLAGRLSLVEGLAFRAADAPWPALVSVHRAGSHLFLRYRFAPSRKEFSA